MRLKFKEKDSVVVHLKSFNYVPSKKMVEKLRYFLNKQGW